MKLKKRAVVILLVCMALFSIVLVFAQESGDEDKVEKAYSCLAEKLGDNCGDTQNTEQSAFNLLSMAWDNSIKGDCKTSLLDKKKENCWGKTASSSCTIKHTAIAVIALNSVGEDTEDYLDWLKTKQKLSRDLEWYLEIDANNQTQCEISTDGRTGTKITILDNKKITGSNPSGLTKAYNDYWFKITNLERNFTISCNENFITTLFYKKPGGNILYIPEQTHAASAGDSTEEKVTSYCFTSSNKCDYEGSLWATLALQDSREDASPYLPYLTALSEDSGNRRYFPSAFLYLLTNSDSYYTNLVNKQNQNKYWKESSDKFYDTAIALLSLQGIDTLEADNAKEYLLDTQDSSGCWGTNTAFLLYAGWPRSSATGTPTPGPVTPSYCADFGDYYCVPTPECSLSDQLGEGFDCINFGDTCCRTQFQEETCVEKSGNFCQSTEICTGNTVTSSDIDSRVCCVGTCQEPEPDVNACVEAEAFCRDECADYQEEKTEYSNSCFPQKCCTNKIKDDSSSLWIWIILLIILIILVALGIIYKDRLRVLLFKKKNKLKSGAGPGRTGRPPIPPPGFRGQGAPRTMPPRPMPSGMRPRPRGRSPMRRPVNRRPARNNKDFDETMRKLREMSK